MRILLLEACAGVAAGLLYTLHLLLRGMQLAGRAIGNRIVGVHLSGIFLRSDRWQRRGVLKASAVSVLVVQDVVELASLLEHLVHLNDLTARRWRVTVPDESTLALLLRAEEVLAVRVEAAVASSGTLAVVERGHVDGARLLGAGAMNRSAQHVVGSLRVASVPFKTLAHATQLALELPNLQILTLDLSLHVFQLGHLNLTQLHLRLL